jgi:iron uptake system component EfeO
MRTPLPRSHSRSRSRPLLALAGAGLLVLPLTACGADDGAGARSASASGSGSLSGSGSQAGSGSLAEQDLSAGTEDPLVLRAVDDYSGYVAGQVDEMIRLTTTFTDAVRAGDLDAAREAYAPSREPWERIEPIAGLIGATDAAVDARVDDFAGPDDPEFTGWHRLEYLLFAKGTTKGAAPFADRLDADLLALQKGLADLEIPPAAIPVGASELIEEVSLGKITGEEDRYSKTDLWDFAANVDGSRKAVEILTPALRKADPDLLSEVESSFAELEATLEPLRRGDGWVLYCQEDDEFPSPRCPHVTVDADTRALLSAQLADLSEQTAQLAGALDLA